MGECNEGGAEKTEKAEEDKKVKKGLAQEVWCCAVARNSWIWRRLSPKSGDDDDLVDLVLSDVLDVVGMG